MPKVELKEGGATSGKERVRIGNYAVAHGSTAALNNFIAKFPV